MGYQGNKLHSSDEGRSKYSKTKHTKNIILVNSEKIISITHKEKVVCHAQFIMNCRYQGRKLGLDISRVSTYYNSNIIGHQNNVLPSDEGSNKVSNTDIDMDSKPNISITQYAKYLFNETLNPNTNTPSSNFSHKDYGTPATLTKV